MQHFPKEGLPSHMAGKPTRFVERIWQSIGDETESDLDSFDEFCEINYDVITTNPYGFDFDSVYGPKRHTIRADKNDRWKVGMDIHFYINCRKPNMFQFAPVIKVTAIQKIEIVHSGESWRVPWVMIDGAIQDMNDIRMLALNDGFESTKDFFSYFNTAFTGKIIHWTPLKY